MLVTQLSQELRLPIIIPQPEPWLSQSFVGFISVGLLSWLHARYVWFPFEHIGFILAIGMDDYEFWTFAAMTWVLKIITLRIGGSKLYEKFGAPLAGGYIAGHMLTLIPGVIIGKVSSSYPF
jgi:hypothetical protein